MREIKFRAYDRGLKKWYYLDLKHALINQTWDMSSKPEDVTDWVQFTGLKDKNGKEIWEGDIVTDGLNKDVVEWYEGEARFDLKDMGIPMWRYANPEKSEDIRILGNIYENPELIK